MTETTATPVRELEKLLQGEIPLAAFMQIELERYDADELRLAAPLEPNRNHKGTGFGGSLAAMATVTGWCFAQLKLREAGRDAELVIYRSDMRYRRPVTSRLVSRCPAPPAEDLERFHRDLDRHGRASLELEVELLEHDRVALGYSGEYVARIPPQAEASPEQEQP